MSNNDKIAELFVDFARNGNLKSLAEAIKLTDDVLENGEDVRDKEIAKNRFKVYKDEQLTKAKRVLDEEDDFRKVKECREALGEFEGAESANSSEDRAKLKKVKDELSKKENRIKPNSPEEHKAQQAENNLIKRIRNNLLIEKARK